MPVLGDFREELKIFEHRNTFGCEQSKWKLKQRLCECECERRALSESITRSEHAYMIMDDRSRLQEASEGGGGINI